VSRRTGTGHHHTRLAPHARRGPVQAKQKWPGRGKAQTLPAATDETVRTSRGKTGGALAEPGEPLHGGASLWRRRRPVLLLEPLSRPPGARRGQPAAWPLQQRWGALGRWLDPQRGEERGAPRFRWTSHFQPCVRCLPPGANVCARSEKSWWNAGGWNASNPRKPPNLEEEAAVGDGRTMCRRLVCFTKTIRPMAHQICMRQKRACKQEVRKEGEARHRRRSRRVRREEFA